MERIIKFRAWDIKAKKFKYPYLWDNTMPSNWDKFYTLQQFTGILDKNGNQVYEGDLIKYENSMESGTGKIEWWPGGFVIVWIEQKTDKPSILSPMFYFACSSELLVIGNIYQHPNLLSNERI